MICYTICFRLMQQSCEQLARGRGRSIMGNPPEPLFHPQFSATETENNDMLGYKTGLGTGRGKGKGKRPASGGKVHSETPMRSRFGQSHFQSRIIWIEADNTCLGLGGKCHEPSTFDALPWHSAQRCRHLFILEYSAQNCYLSAALMGANPPGERQPLSA